MDNFDLYSCLLQKLAKAGDVRSSLAAPHTFGKCLYRNPSKVLWALHMCLDSKAQTSSKLMG